ncbi:hypothetical protein [Sphingosinicella sp. BN140058]|uniref:hypothetical protein n=1 Tax=Sphingosinicella sp. BN140058 TaxID=1892855 RepID=UPI001012A489|nr:hypothetical protein [Sphingosinicella sp. BN140058]QAY80481.1 hypothetical protein ETR14_27980 [Sphingosinicella sp. BN140058]
MSVRRYQPEVPEMGLYIPAATPALAAVKKGSAIVGAPREGYLVVYYEGGIYQHNKDMPFAEKLAIAAGRLSDRAPTVALAAVQDSDVQRVGTVSYDQILRGWILSDLTDAAALADWLGSGDELVVGGTPEQRQRAAGLILDEGRGGTGAIMAYQRARAEGRDGIEALIEYDRQNKEP